MYAFSACTNLTNISLPGVGWIDDYAFDFCPNLRALFFYRDAPSVKQMAFSGTTNAIAYYLPGTSGWGPTFGGIPTALWVPAVQTHDSVFGIQNNVFGFTIVWASGRLIVVEASTSLANATWTPLQTNTLAGGSSYFSDPQWTNYPRRFYRLRWP